MAVSQDLLCLHKVKHGNAKAVVDLLKGGIRDNLEDGNGESPVHVYAKRKDFHCLMALLLHGNPRSVNVTNKDGRTALHISVEGRDVDCVSLLLAFSADVNAFDRRDLTALDIADRTHNDHLVQLILGVGGKRFETIQKADSDGAVPQPARRNTERIEMMVERIKHEQPMDSITSDIIAVLQNLRTVPPKHHRILCLDGGGMKGLIQIEVLMQIEKYTGKNITELFDWIVGTSTGGIVALGLVYAKLSLFDLRKLYFEMCDQVFTCSGFGANSEKMNQLLRSTFKDARMNDVSEPRVLVTAVNAENTDLSLVFFNNCFDDDYSKEMVWKVARCTSAAPGYFEPMDKYIDGGVRANNPCNYALTKIQDSIAEQTKVYELSGRTTQLPEATIGCLLSVGCGTYPPEVLKDFNPSIHLFVGKRLNTPLRFMHQIEELIKLLATAVTYSEGEGDNCRSRCEKQGIKYYRLCPYLSEVVPSNETDKKKLCRVIIEAKMHLEAFERPFKQLLNSFH